jgi:prepilin-type processing-associated H-X9-DG protein
MVSNYNSSPTASYIYLTFDGGTVSWTGTSNAAFADGAEYNWVAIGYA